MNKTFFHIKKWTARALVAIGTMLGFSTCGSGGCSSPYETVYGPPPEMEDSAEVEVVEDVYGPPIKDIDSTIDPEMVEVVYGPPADMLDTVPVPDEVKRNNTKNKGN